MELSFPSSDLASWFHKVGWLKRDIIYHHQGYFLEVRKALSKAKEYILQLFSQAEYHSMWQVNYTSGGKIGKVPL